MSKSLDIHSLVKARETHNKEVELLEFAIKEAINNAVDGMNIETVCLGENEDDSFNFTIWGKLTAPPGEQIPLDCSKYERNKTALATAVAVGYGIDETATDDKQGRLKDSCLVGLDEPRCPKYNG
jgi:hypothetical protein